MESIGVYTAIAFGVSCTMYMHILLSTMLSFTHKPQLLLSLNPKPYTLSACR